MAFFLGTNLVNQMPDTAGTRAALAGLDFRIVADQFLTDTAECCDLFLPTTSMPEEEDFLPSYGHLWMQLMQPVVPPRGECRSDLAILQALAERLGFGPDMAGTPSYWIDRLTEPFRAQGISHGALATAGAINSQIPEERQRGPVAARVHPATAAAAGLAAEGPAALVSPRGRLPVRLEIDAAVRRDSVLVPKGERAKQGRGLNVLVEPRYTAGTGTAYNQNFVRLEPA